MGRVGVAPTQPERVIYSHLGSLMPTADPSQSSSSSSLAKATAMSQVRTLPNQRLPSGRNACPSRYTLNPCPFDPTVDIEKFLQSDTTV